MKLQNNLIFLRSWHFWGPPGCLGTQMKRQVDNEEEQIVDLCLALTELNLLSLVSQPVLANLTPRKLETGITSACREHITILQQPQTSHTITGEASTFAQKQKGMGGSSMMARQFGPPRRTSQPMLLEAAPPSDEMLSMRPCQSKGLTRQGEGHHTDSKAGRHTAQLG